MNRKYGKAILSNVTGFSVLFSAVTQKPQGPAHFVMCRAPKLLFPNGKMSGAKISTKIERATEPGNKTQTNE
jgi:hypothetical protein